MFYFGDIDENVEMSRGQTAFKKQMSILKCISNCFCCVVEGIWMIIPWGLIDRLKVHTRFK